MTPDADLPAELSKLQKGYELLGELSRDEMVTVYVARDRLSGNEVGIKVLRATDARGREALAHYASDARLLTALEHPNIVGVHGVKWLSENVVAVITERVRGPSLRQVLDVAGTLPVARATEVLRGLGRALAWAHSSQIMHRDLRPENVIFEDGTGRVVLSDFGLARRIEAASSPALAGAEAYQAPELADGRYPDRRSDVYSLGVVGWELLTGRQPYPDTMEPIAPGSRPPAPPPLAAVRPGLPPTLVSAIEGAVQLDRDRRISDVVTFMDRLVRPPKPGEQPEEPEPEIEPDAAMTFDRAVWLAAPRPKMPSLPTPADLPVKQGGEPPAERPIERKVEHDVERKVERAVEVAPPATSAPSATPNERGDEALRAAAESKRRKAKKSEAETDVGSARGAPIPVGGQASPVEQPKPAVLSKPAQTSRPESPESKADHERPQPVQAEPPRAASPLPSSPRAEPPRPVSPPRPESARPGARLDAAASALPVPPAAPAAPVSAATPALPAEPPPAFTERRNPLRAGGPPADGDRATGGRAKASRQEPVRRDRSHSDTASASSAAASASAAADSRAPAARRAEPASTTDQGVRSEPPRPQPAAPRSGRSERARAEAARAQAGPPLPPPVLDTPVEFPLPVMPDPRPMPADAGADAGAGRGRRWSPRAIAIAVGLVLLVGAGVVVMRMERAPDTTGELMQPETPTGYGGDVALNPKATDSTALTVPGAGRAATAGGANRRGTTGAGTAATPGGTLGAPRPPAAAGASPSGTTPAPTTPSRAGPAARGGITPTTSGGRNPAASASVPASTAAAAAARTASPAAAVSVEPARNPAERADGFARCNSPALADQRACLSANLARSDAGLNQTYADVIAAMRRRASTAPGEPDPPEVQRLRAAQRAWIDRRDAECRQRGRGREGPVWAPSRARCLQEFSVDRARELSGTLARLRQD